MNKTQKNIWLYVSIGAILLFIFTFLSYIQNSPIIHLGPWPLIVISGVVIIALITALVVSVVNLFRYKFHWQGLVTITLSTITLIPLCYAFPIWMIFGITGL